MKQEIETNTFLYTVVPEYATKCIIVSGEKVDA